MALYLSSRGIKCEALHSDLTQSAREHVMEAFRAGKLSSIVATDVAARGIDVSDCDLVNFFSPLFFIYFLPF